MGWWMSQSDETSYEQMRCSYIGMHMQFNIGMHDVIGMHVYICTRWSGGKHGLDRPARRPRALHSRASEPAGVRSVDGRERCV